MSYWPFNVELPPDSSRKWVREEEPAMYYDAETANRLIPALLTVLENEREERAHQMVIWRTAIQDAHADIKRLEEHIEAWRTKAHEANMRVKAQAQTIKAQMDFTEVQADKITGLEEEVQALKNQGLTWETSEHPRAVARRKAIRCQAPPDHTD